MNVRKGLYRLAWLISVFVPGAITLSVLIKQLHYISALDSLIRGLTIWLVGFGMTWLLYAFVKWVIAGFQARENSK